MKLLEFPFNPKADGSSVRKLLSKQDKVILLGEIERPLPRNRKLIDELFSIAENNYRPKATAKQQVKQTLKTVNAFLDLQRKQGNIDWLGKLHCLFLFFSPGKKYISLYAAGLGKTKLYLLRGKKLIEIQQTQEKETKIIAPNSFGSFVSGQLVPGDRVFLFTKELTPPLVKEKLLSQISLFEKEKDFHAFFRLKRKHFIKSMGLLGILQIPLAKDGQSSSSPLLRQKLSVSMPTFNVTKNQLLFIMLITILGVGFVFFRLL